MWRSETRAARAGSAAALAVLLIVAAAVPSIAETPVFAEGEDYLNYVWYNIGGFDIRVESCSGASQGYAAGGLDVAGEWIMLKAAFPRAGCYEAHVFYQAEYGDTVAFDVKLLDPSVPGGFVPASFAGPGWGFG
jgi:hypothetical protein